MSSLRLRCGFVAAYLRLPRAFLADRSMSTNPHKGLPKRGAQKIQEFQEGARKLQEMQGICHKCVKVARECTENPRKSKKIKKIQENQGTSTKIKENPRKSAYLRLPRRWADIDFPPYWRDIWAAPKNPAIPRRCKKTARNARNMP